MMCRYVDGPLVCASEEACLCKNKNKSAEEKIIIGKLNCVTFISVTYLLVVPYWMWVLFKTRWGLEPYGRDHRLIIPLHFVSSHGLPSEGTKKIPFIWCYFIDCPIKGQSVTSHHLVSPHWLSSEGSSPTSFHGCARKGQVTSLLLVSPHRLSSEGMASYSVTSLHFVSLHWLWHLCCRHFRRYLNIFVEFIPEIIFLGCLFGYLVALVFYKWVTFEPADSKCAPALLIREFFCGKSGEGLSMVFWHVLGVINVCLKWNKVARSSYEKKKYCGVRVFVLDSLPILFTWRKKLHIPVLITSLSDNLGVHQ